MNQSTKHNPSPAASPHPGLGVLITHLSLGWCHSQSLSPWKTHQQPEFSSKIEMRACHSSEASNYFPLSPEVTAKAVVPSTAS